jgi:hypothetical protein
MTEPVETYPDFRQSDIDELEREKYRVGEQPSWPVDGPVTQSMEALWFDSEYAIAGCLL